MCDLQMRKDTRINSHRTIWNSKTHPIKHSNNRGLDSNKNKPRLVDIFSFRISIGSVQKMSKHDSVANTQRMIRGNAIM